VAPSVGPGRKTCIAQDIPSTLWYPTQSYGYGEATGGGISLEQNGTIVLKGSSAVTGNRTDRWGGGIDLGWHGTLIMRGASVVCDNAAERGGGVRMRRRSEVWLYDGSSVVGNQATDWGGGLAGRGLVHVCSGNAAISPNDPDDPPPTLPCT
jgi:hypothetical protein